MATSPATAHADCRSTNVYGEPNFSFAITAEALNTMVRPTNTSSSVTMNNHLSAKTRLAMARSALGRRPSAIGVMRRAHTLCSVDECARVITHRMHCDFLSPNREQRDCEPLQQFAARVTTPRLHHATL